MDIPHLSIIIPAYNEEKRIGTTLESIKKYVESKGLPVEVIVVLNNTKDNTRGVVEKYQHSMPYIKIMDTGIVPSKSGTKGYAIKWGVAEARGRYIVFMDADNATEIQEVEKMWPKFDEGYDVVIGSRYIHGSNVKRAWYRKLVSYFLNMFIRILLSFKVSDMHCGFKAFTAQAGKDIFSRMVIKGWAFDNEIFAITFRKGYRLAEVPVSWVEMGQSRLSIRTFASSFPELLTVRRNLKNGKYD